MPDLSTLLRMSESGDYKARSAAEYLFIKDKYEKLHRMIVKREAGTLGFEPNVPMERWKAQAAAMGERPPGPSSPACRQPGW